MKQKAKRYRMSRGKGHIPIRTCICCGAKRGKKELLRLILDAGGVVVRDVGRQGEGRGAYVCADKSCLTALKISRRLNRAFRTKGIVTVHPDSFLIGENVGCAVTAGDERKNTGVCG